MLLSSHTTCVAAIFILQWMCGCFNAITTPSGQPVVTLVFVSEETQHYHLNTAFEFFLQKENEGVSTTFSLEGITVEWKKNDTPNLTYEKIQEIITKQNATAVISFLPPKKNHFVVNALSKAVIPIIGLESLTEEVYSSKKEGALYLSMFPTDALQASIIKDLMLEFEERRFACITTDTSRNDALFSYLGHYTVNNGQQAAAPRCIILRENNLMEELSAGLATISASGVRLLVVHCKDSESIAIVALARKFKFKLLGRDFVWIFTDKAVTSDASSFPEGSFGIVIGQRIGNASVLYKGLLEDSVKLIANSLIKAHSGSRPHGTRSERQQGQLFASHKRQIYREMVNRSFLGQTGPVQFSRNGERTSFKFTIVKAVRQHEEAQAWHVMGYACPEWTHDDSPHNLEAFLPKDLPTPRHLRIVTIKHEPFTAIHDVYYSSRLGMSCPANTVPCREFNNGSHTSSVAHGELWKESEGTSKMLCCYGVMIDILLKMLEIEEFSFDLYLVRDGKYGSLDPDTKQMNGMIGDVYRGFADLALAVITITEERSEYVGFTTPYIGTTLKFLVKRFKSRNRNFAQTISDMRLMKSFSMELWFACLAAFCAIAITVWGIEKVYYYREHKSPYLLPFEFVAYVYGNIFHVPLTKIQAKSYSVPFVMVVVNFAGLVLVSSYTANLLASLITVEDITVVSGIGDEKLVDPPEGFTFGAIKDTSTEDFFRKSSSARLRKIYENMKNHNVETFSDGMKKVRSGELKVFIAETDADEDSNCEIKEDGVPFELSGFAFALPKNSSWNHQLSRAIHKLNAHDTIPNIFLKWTTSRCKTSQQTVVAHRMGLDEFGGFLFNTAMICCGCFILMLAEILVYRKITRTRRSFSPQQNGVVLNAVTLPENSSMTSILNN